MDRTPRNDASTPCWRSSPPPPDPGWPASVDPLVNIIVDQTTLEHHLATLAGADVAPLDPATVDERRCETTQRSSDRPGRHARRCRSPVTSAGSCSTPPGSSSISGRRAHGCSPAAPAKRCGLADRWCMWPGCDLRSGRCQTDHTTPWARDGPTRPRQRRTSLPTPQPLETTRLPNRARPSGHWHTYRPDGTEIGNLNPPATNTAA